MPLSCPLIWLFLYIIVQRKRKPRQIYIFIDLYKREVLLIYLTTYAGLKKMTAMFYQKCTLSYSKACAKLFALLRIMAYICRKS